MKPSRRSTKARQEAQRRSEAAKRGWETRRRAARSEAARKGWETRKSNARAKAAKKGWATRREREREKAIEGGSEKDFDYNDYDDEDFIEVEDPIFSTGKAKK